MKSPSTLEIELFQQHKSTLACECGKIGTFETIHANGKTYCTDKDCKKRPSLSALLYANKLTIKKGRKPYTRKSLSPPIPPTSPPSTSLSQSLPPPLENNVQAMMAKIEELI